LIVKISVFQVWRPVFWQEVTNISVEHVGNPRTQPSSHSLQRNLQSSDHINEYFNIITGLNRKIVHCNKFRKTNERLLVVISFLLARVNSLYSTPIQTDGTQKFLR
jgi:hypothetical protein